LVGFPTPSSFTKPTSTTQEVDPFFFMFPFLRYKPLPLFFRIVYCQQKTCFPNPPAPLSPLPPISWKCSMQLINCHRNHTPVVLFPHLGRTGWTFGFMFLGWPVLRIVPHFGFSPPLPQYTPPPHCSTAAVDMVWLCPAYFFVCLFVLVSLPARFFFKPGLTIGKLFLSPRVDRRPNTKKTHHKHFSFRLVRCPCLFCAWTLLQWKSPLTTSGTWTYLLPNDPPKQVARFGSPSRHSFHTLRSCFFLNLARSF